MSESERPGGWGGERSEDSALDRPVVSGSDDAGPVMPGGAPTGAPSDGVVSGAADPGASHADPDAGRMAGGDQPTAPNQQKTEPVPPSGTGDLPSPVASRPDEEAGNSTGPGPREGGAGTVPTSDHADVHGVKVPDETPAEGTSEGMAPIEGVTFPAVAPEGLADGETDVAMPSTTHF